MANKIVSRKVKVLSQTSTHKQTGEQLKPYRGFTIHKFVYTSKSGLKRIDYQAWSRFHNNKKFTAKTYKAIKNKIDKFANKLIGW